MVSLRATILGLAALAMLGVDGSRARAEDEVASALREERLPWYDARNDAARPTWPQEAQEAEGPAERPSSISGLLGLIAWGVALTVLVVGIMWIVSRFEPTPMGPVAPVPLPAGATRVGDLPMPPGLGLDLGDPWAEAARRRASGDLGGAIVALIAHQLVTLDRLGLSRLAPGKTARQVVRGVSDRRVRGAIEPTLRLFEASYYGRQPPSPSAFEAAWASAEALERSWPAGVAS
jgi:hypothetical protein